MGLPVVFGLAIFTLPAFWTGSLGYRKIFKRVCRKSDGFSLVLALVPLILWLAAYAFFNIQAGQPIGFYLPTWLFKPSEYKLQALLLIFITNPSGLIGLLVLANSSNYSDRIKFILLATAISIFIRVAQFGASYMMMPKPLGDPVLQAISPVFDILRDIGMAIVIVGLLQRGRNSVKAIAIFLCAYTLIQFFASLGRVEPMMIGLLGGGAIIWIVNYLQQAREVEALVPAIEGREKIAT
jgi:hypothetical protein